MSKLGDKVTEFFNTAEAVQVEDGTWYYHESSVEKELLSVYEQLAKANERAEKAEKEVARLKGIFYKWKEEKDNAVWESDTVFNSLMASSQYYLLEEGLEYKEWFKKHVNRSIDKFALENKIEGAYAVISLLDPSKDAKAILMATKYVRKQLRKEQDDGLQ